MFITGASRGIGLAIGLRAAADGANVVVTGKTDAPHPKLPGTIHTAAAAIEAAGGQALAVAMDLRDEAQVRAAVKAAVERFGGIDVLVNNASAIYLTGTLDTPIRRFDLMHQVNARGTFLATQYCLPHLLRAANPHVLNIAPPLNLNPRWFAPHLAYTMAKYGMSLCVLGMAEEFRAQGVAVNALWPRTAIDTAAIALIAGEETRRRRTRRASNRRRRRPRHPHPSQPRVHRPLLHRRRGAARGRRHRPVALSPRRCGGGGVGADARFFSGLGARDRVLGTGAGQNFGRCRKSKGPGNPRPFVVWADALDKRQSPAPSACTD